MTQGGPPRAGTRSTEPLTVALVNDFVQVVTALEARLRRHGSAARVVDAEAGADDVGTADVVLFDTFGTRRSALRRLRSLRASDRHGAVVVSALDASDLFLDALARLGVDAVVHSAVDDEVLLHALRQASVGRGGTAMLHPIESGLRVPDDVAPVGADAEVVALAMSGLDRASIADELMCSELAVHDAIMRALRSLSLADTTMLRSDRRLRHLLPATRAERWRVLPREPGQVAVARRFVEDRLRLGAADADTVALFRLAVSELGANAVEHGAGATWTVGAYGSRDWWSLEVSCVEGPGGSLLHRPWEWAIASSAEPSGRGLGIVRAVMDEVTTTVAAGQLRVVCRRRRERGDAGPFADGPR